MFSVNPTANLERRIAQLDGAAEQALLDLADALNAVQSDDRSAAIAAIEAAICHLQIR